jgi:predicted lipid-binding transport protein (Tim44 family)
MQYVFSMTSRMVTIALGSALLLGVLLFLLGMQIGARLSADTPAQPQPMNSASWSAAIEPARLRAVAAPGAGQAPAQRQAAPEPAPATAGAADAANPDASSDSPDTADGAATQPAAVVPVVVPAAADSGS